MRRWGRSWVLQNFFSVRLSRNGLRDTFGTIAAELGQRFLFIRAKRKLLTNIFPPGNSKIQPQVSVSLGWEASHQNVTRSVYLQINSIFKEENGTYLQYVLRMYIKRTVIHTPYKSKHYSILYSLWKLYTGIIVTFLCLFILGS